MLNPMRDKKWRHVPEGRRDDTCDQGLPKGRPLVVNKNSYLVRIKLEVKVVFETKMVLPNGQARFSPVVLTSQHVRRGSIARFLPARREEFISGGRYLFRCDHGCDSRGIGSSDMIRCFLLRALTVQTGQDILPIRGGHPLDWTLSHLKYTEYSKGIEPWHTGSPDTTRIFSRKNKYPRSRILTYFDIRTTEAWCMFQVQWVSTQTRTLEFGCDEYSIIDPW